MSTQDNPPTKRRRRWLIVAFVLAIVSLGTWWYWPPGDARFVGTWRATRYQPVCLHFSSRGTGTESLDPEFYPEGTQLPENFVWWIKGNMLTLYYPDNSNPLFVWFDSIAARTQIPISLRGSWSFYEIVEIDGSQLVLKIGLASENVERFVRVPK